MQIDICLQIRCFLHRTRKRDRLGDHLRESFVLSRNRFVHRAVEPCGEPGGVDLSAFFLVDVCLVQRNDNRDTKFQGKLEELAKEFDMDPVVFCGFMDGINTSLVNGYDVECLEETSDIVLDVDFEKLFYNMLEAKAKWLYTLPEWNDVLPLEKRQEITRAWRKSKQVINDQKIGRNDPCPCGSGLKYKKCCGKSA